MKPKDKVRGKPSILMAIIAKNCEQKMSRNANHIKRGEKNFEIKKRVQKNKINKNK